MKKPHFKTQDERLKVIYTCNELNAGYAADGYSRARRGKAACVVATFTVGGLSLLNAIAGAASESLPVICVTGGPNSNDGGTNRVLHHTIGSSESFNQEMEAFKPFVCKATRIFALEDAHWQLDDCIAEALRQSKPGKCERKREKLG
jgi:pyruvate decarboxylase